ncbi:winged helix-turn-helix domain-containing protein [Leminorella grimontii]|uniref:winged helix-turn-helix domain-containing protein n=1 Tax=Leminorella grimontii TaxID=82981 RepID=UPI00208405AA|nr:winged helix-turn-helix domain-containing protein [Leminorella grimontii]GKX58657.1 hypothetical protein SOASR031_09720 [Leminorella grimontii]
MKEFIIDKEIIFTPHDRLLRSIKTTKKTHIHNNSARCLELLLEKHGQIVLQSELMIVGWGEDALKTITNATYYQCFVNLRKSLKGLGYNKELIVTIRQKGIRIPQYIDVETKTAINSELIGEEKEENPNAESFDKEELTVLDKTKGSNELAIKKAQFSFKKGAALFSIAALLIAYPLYHSYESTHKNKPLIGGFSNVKEYPPCFYFNKNNKDNAFAYDFAIENHYSCKGNKEYYISYFSTAPRVSIFSCNAKNKMACDSTTYIIERKKG